MKLVHATVILSSILATSSAFASTFSGNSTASYGSMAGIKVATSIKNNVNDDDEFQDINLEIEEVMGFGAFYSTNGDNGNGLGFEADFMLNQEADMLMSGVDVGDVSTYKLGLYLNYHLPVTDKVFAKSKIGYERSYGTMEIPITGDDVELGEAGVSVGIGAGMDLTDRLGVLAEYKYTHSAEKMNLLSIGAYTKF